MKAPVNPFFLLFGLVLTIYVMRHGDISVGSTVKRILQEYRPSASLCKGTSLDQVYSQSEIERAESFKKSLQGMRGGNPMKDLLLYKPFEAQSFLDYFMGALAFIVPWAVMFILSLLSAIVITCNWCCIYGCCKNAKCCKCCKEPKDSSKKRIYVFISAIFALAGVGSGIAGIVMSSGVPKGIELTMCSVIAIVEDLTYGLPSDHWLGVEGALTAIENLQLNFTTVKNKLSASSASTSPALTAKNDVSTQLSNMITALDINGNKNFQRPDPSETTYTPLNITNIGPKTSSYTMTGLIETEVDVYYQVVKTAQDSIDSAINTIKTGNIEPMIEEGREDVAEFANTFQDALKSVNDFGSIGKSAITGIGAGLTAIFAATLVFSIFAVGAMIMVGLCKMKSFNKFLHSSWMGFTIMSIFGFLLSTILYPLSLVLMETCDVVQTALDDSDTMSQLMGNALDGNSAGEIIDLCLFRGGDVIAYFGLDSSLSSFKSINDQFSAVKAVMPLAKTAPVSKTLAYEYDIVDGMTSGKYLDLEPTIDMATLNSKTNHNPNTCTNIYDRWEGNSVNCTSDKGTLFESSSAATFNLGSPTCIGLDKWTATTRAATDRYGPPQSSFSSCGNTGAFTTENYVTTFVTNFQTNRVRVATLFSDIKNQLDLVQPKYDTFADKVKDVLSGLVDIQGDLESVNAALYDDNTGLFNNMKCSFIKTGLDRFVDSMCVGFISSLYQASVVIIICSVMSFFGAIFVFCLAKRFILEDPNTKPKPV